MVTMRDSKLPQFLGDIPSGGSEKTQTETPLMITATSAMAAHKSSHHQRRWIMLYQSRHEVNAMAHVWTIVTDTWLFNLLVNI